MAARRLIFPAAEVRAAEDADSRILEGVVVRYGDLATIRGGIRERFAPGAFQGRMDDVVLNVQHQRGVPIARTGAGLALEDSADALEVRADLPVTAAGSEALAMVRGGILRGLSVEFRAVREAMEGGVRVIREAWLDAIGVVDKAAYPASTVEARHLERPEHWRRIPWL